MGAFRPSMPEVTRLKTFGRAREAQVDSVDDHGTAPVPTWHDGVIAGATSSKRDRQTAAARAAAGVRRSPSR